FRHVVGVVSVIPGCRVEQGDGLRLQQMHDSSEVGVPAERFDTHSSDPLDWICRGRCLHHSGHGSAVIAAASAPTKSPSLPYWPERRASTKERLIRSTRPKPCNTSAL